jgi:CubicO group peptidase (beta-lactamase class C family)
MRKVLPLVLLAGCAAPLPPSEPPPPAACEAPLRPEPAETPADPPLVVRTQPPPPSGYEERRRQLDGIKTALDAHLDAQLKEQGLPGFTFGVVVGGQLAYARAVGLADLDSQRPAEIGTVYRIGSITKTFTATAILRLRDEGKLALDVPASRYLAELGKVAYPSTDSPPITLRHLLTHSSGLPRLGNFTYTDGVKEPTTQEILGALATTRLQYVPGTGDVYSNFAFSLLGIIAGQVSGKGYREYLKETIFTPLGMATATFDEKGLPAGKVATGYSKKDGKHEKITPWRLGASEGAGGLFASLDDMARYAAFQLDAYPPRDDADRGPLRRATTREAHRTVRHTGLSTSEGERPEQIDATATGQGLAWQTLETCEDDEIVWHSGAVDGFTSSLTLLPRAGVGLILLVNDIGADRARITQKARALLRAAGVLAPRKPDTAALTRAIGEVTALYNEHDEKRYETLFAASFRQAVSSLKLRAINAALREKHGTCAPGRALEIESATEGRFELTCQRGHLEASGTMDGDGAFAGFFIRSYLPPSPAMSEALALVIDPKKRAKKKDLFATPEARAEAEKKLAPLGATCRLDEPREAPGDREQIFRLTCGQGTPRKLTLKLDAKDPKRVESVAIEALPAKNKCVGHGR